MPATVRFDEYVVANNLSFGGWAAWVESYAPLLDDPPPVGENVRIPGRPGREPYPADVDQLHVTLVVNVDGDYNFDDDDVNADPKQGLITNRAAMREALGPGLLATGDGTVQMDWHQPDGSTVVTVDVQSLGFIGWTYLSPSFARTTWDLLVPVGAFEELGS